MSPNSDRSGVIFGVELSVPVVGGNPAQRREHDKLVGLGTMSAQGPRAPSAAQYPRCRTSGWKARLTDWVMC